MKISRILSLLLGTLATTTLTLVGTTEVSQAGNNGQQLLIEAPYHRYVKVTGRNQSGRYVTWTASTNSSGGINVTTHNWWWKGKITVTVSNPIHRDYSNYRCTRTIPKISVFNRYYVRCPNIRLAR